MKTLFQIEFIVVVVLVASHPVNRKFFTHFLCVGELQTSVIHPYNITRKLYFIFDLVHNLKNIYNCFQRQEYSSIPLNRLGVKSSLHPNLTHIKEIHHKGSRKSSETTIEAIVDTVVISQGHKWARFLKSS
uniref:Putative LOC101846817 [Aplysia californica] n=1 Tax=Lepeophtheirus salmonis TaxID=72036 RepID=A0A0K2TUV4_LEPSM